MELVANHTPISLMDFSAILTLDGIGKCHRLANHTIWIIDFEINGATLIQLMSEHLMEIKVWLNPIYIRSPTILIRKKNAGNVRKNENSHSLYR